VTSRAILTSEEIARLESFDAGDARVLSAYLDLRPARQVERTYQVVFRDLDKAARPDLEAEAAEMRRGSRARSRKGRGSPSFPARGAASGTPTT
jgi:hypothetical protein